MTPRVRPLLAGNWKMNGTKASASELTALIDAYVDDLKIAADVLICPPATLIMGFAKVAEHSGVMIGGQDCHAAVSGAHTGDVAAEMLRDAGATHVIVGHSERRANHGETDAVVAQKAAAAQRAGLCAIVCVGETEEQRNARETIAVVERQLAGSLPMDMDAADLILAYEPVWAIGTGRTPTPDDVADVHAAIRRALLARFGGEGQSMRILYGGSVKPDNAADLLCVENVNGALVGGASLRASDFLAILRAYAPLLPAEGGSRAD